MNNKKIRKVGSFDAMPPVVEAEGEYFSTRILEDKYRKMYTLCKSVFDNPMVQMYAGANYECLFCGGHYLYDKQGDGVVKHKSGCPCLDWIEIKRRVGN